MAGFDIYCIFSYCVGFMHEWSQEVVIILYTYVHTVYNVEVGR